MTITVTVLQLRKDFNCDTCKWGRHCDDSNPAPLKQWLIEDSDIESDICFLPMITERSLFFIRLHTHYRNQILFADGGITSQPNVYLEAMEHIESVRNE